MSDVRRPNGISTGPYYRWLKHAEEQRWLLWRASIQTSHYAESNGGNANMMVAAK